MPGLHVVRRGAVFAMLVLASAAPAQDELYGGGAAPPISAPPAPPDLRFGGQAAAEVSAPSANIDELLRDIQQAADPSAAVDAYARALAVAPDAVVLELAYVRRMVDLGAPQVAEMQAADLVERDPQNGLAWAVLAFNSGVKHDTAQALKEIMTAVQYAPEEAFVQRTAGQLLAWYDVLGDPQAIPVDLREALARFKTDFGGRAFYADAYAAAREYYERTRNEPPPPVEEPVAQAPAGGVAPAPPPPAAEYYPPVGWDDDDWEDYWDDYWDELEDRYDDDDGWGFNFGFGYGRGFYYPYSTYYPASVPYYYSGAPAWTTAVIVPRHVHRHVYDHPTLAVRFGIHRDDHRVIRFHERVARLVPRGGRRIHMVRGHDAITVARPDRAGRGTRVVSVPRRTLASDPVIRRDWDRWQGRLSSYRDRDFRRGGEREFRGRDGFDRERDWGRDRDLRAREQDRGRNFRAPARELDRERDWGRDRDFRPRDQDRDRDRSAPRRDAVERNDPRERDRGAPERPQARPAGNLEQAPNRPRADQDVSRVPRTERAQPRSTRRETEQKAPRIERSERDRSERERARPPAIERSRPEPRRGSEPRASSPERRPAPRVQSRSAPDEQPERGRIERRPRDPSRTERDR